MPQANGLGRLGNDSLQPFGSDRFFEKIIRAFAHGIDRPRDGRMSGHQYDFEFFLGFFGLLENAHSVDVIHHQIGDHDVIQIFSQQLEPLRARGSDRAIEPNSLEAFIHGPGQVFVIIDNQYPDRERRWFFKCVFHAQIIQNRVSIVDAWPHALPQRENPAGGILPAIMPFNNGMKVGVSCVVKWRNRTSLNWPSIRAVEDSRRIQSKSPITQKVPGTVELQRSEPELTKTNNSGVETPDVTPTGFYRFKNTRKPYKLELSGTASPGKSPPNYLFLNSMIVSAFLAQWMKHDATHRCGCNQDGKHKMRNGFVKLTIVVALVLCGSVVVGSLFFNKGNRQVAAATNALTYKVFRGEFVSSVNESGEIESSSNIEIRCRVKGNGRAGTTVLKVVPEGTMVKKGDFICQLDDSILREELIEQNIKVAQDEASVIQAHSDLDTATRSLDEFKNGTFEQDRAELKAAVAFAEETSRRAREYTQYSESLNRKGYITRTQLEADTYAAEKAELDLTARPAKAQSIRRIHPRQDDC